MVCLWTIPTSPERQRALLRSIVVSCIPCTRSSEALSVYVRVIHGDVRNQPGLAQIKSELENQLCKLTLPNRRCKKRQQTRHAMVTCCIGEVVPGQDAAALSNIPSTIRDSESNLKISRLPTPPPNCVCFVVVASPSHRLILRLCSLLPSLMMWPVDTRGERPGDVRRGDEQPLCLSPPRPGPPPPPPKITTSLPNSATSIDNIIDHC
jgi:hypothetical protein